MILGIIPARYASTRFPGKPLVLIKGKSMIQRVYEQAKKCSSLYEVLVATDDFRIFDHVHGFGGRAIMTDPGHQSGTDRCAEVAAEHPEASIIINIQGDEPFIKPNQIEQVASLFALQEEWAITTLVRKIENKEALFSPDVVKAVLSARGEALYFSRQPIPYLRDQEEKNWLSSSVNFYKHLGIYGYRREALLNLANLPVGTLEAAEKLEQLRWLEAGYRIGAGITQYDSIGIDKPEDLPS